MSLSSKGTQTLQSIFDPRSGVTRQIINQLGVAVASKLVPLAGIFIYSRMMSVTDFGSLNLFQSYLWVFVIVLSLNLHVAVGRYVYAPDVSFQSFLGTVLFSLGIIFVAGTITMTVFEDAISLRIGIPSVVLPLMLLIVAGQIAESLITQITIHDERGEVLLCIVGGKALVSLCLSLTFLIFWGGEKFLAVLYGDAIASLILCISVLVLLWQRIEWSLRRDHFTSAVRYALPLVPYMLGLTVLSQSDRVLINHIYGSEATGLYSLSYNVGALLLMVATAIINAFTPSFFAALNRQDYDRVNEDARIVFALALVATLMIVLFGQQVASLLLPARYSEGFVLIPVVALGGLCSVIFQIWVRVLAYFHKTATISLIAVGCAVLNIALNLWLLPLFGWQFAAWTTVIAYFCMSLACHFVINVCSLLKQNRTWRDEIWISLMFVLVLITLHMPLSWELSLGVLVVVTWLIRRELLALMTRSRN
jgi:O-antigen/teichoic acid export membrane protein